MAQRIYVGEAYFANHSGFYSYPLNRILPVWAGIYIMCRQYEKDGMTKFRPLYIGQAGNIRQRVRGHEKWDCVMPKGCNCICVKQVAWQSERDRIEADLIREFAPDCNKQHTSGYRNM